jgi:YhcG PDDEXK nuclease domain
MKPGENPPVGLILCAEKGASEAHYALDNLPNKVLAAEYQTVLPDEKLIADELERSRLECGGLGSVLPPPDVLRGKALGY